MLAHELRGFGYDVTEHVGNIQAGMARPRHLRADENGAGPTVLVVLTWMPLPVEEQTGLPTQSRAAQK